MKKSNPSHSRRIHPPKTDARREIVRAAVDGVIGQIPLVGSVLNKIYEKTHPPKSQKDRESWEAQISDRSNEHDQRIGHVEQWVPKTRKLSETTALLCVELAKRCKDGLLWEDYEEAELRSWFPNVSDDDIDDAVYELENLVLVSRSHTLNSGWRLRLEQAFFEEIDHQVMEWNTLHDALTIAELMLSNKTGDAKTLHELTGWEKRRFNPALAYLLPLFADGAIRKVLQPDYVTAGVLISADQSAALRQFIREYKVD